MSEYQYYEFLALNKPLTEKQRAELRKLSSRAEITATRFVNEYNYGDFRGGPEKLMERYSTRSSTCELGTRLLMFRFPHALLDAEVARQYCHTDVASVIETSDHVIVSLYLTATPTTTGLRRTTGSGCQSSGFRPGFSPVTTTGRTAPWC